MKNKKNCLLQVEQLEDRLTPSPVSLNPSSGFLPPGQLNQLDVSGYGQTVGSYAVNPTNSPTSPVT
jgi:hypothetical protein